MFDFLKRNQPMEPIITGNTFLLWEPCSQNHAEVAPGFARYLLDLGYSVSVLVTPERMDEGLFSLFGENERLHLNRMPQQQIRKSLLEKGIGQAKGILISTIPGKIDIRKIPLAPGQKCLCVSHDVKDDAAMIGAIGRKTITLRRVAYEDLQTAVVNPHYFGEVPSVPKNRTVNFITVGALRDKRRNTALLIDAARQLRDNGWRHFRITVIGKGKLRDIPEELNSYFHVPGRVDFREMYEQIQKADFFLPLLDENNPEHDRYITTGTSGSFQLIRGFRKPPLLAFKFAPINGFDPRCGIIYESSEKLSIAMDWAMRMTPESYAAMQRELEKSTKALYRESLENLRNLIED